MGDNLNKNIHFLLKQSNYNIALLKKATTLAITKLLTSKNTNTYKKTAITIIAKNFNIKKQNIIQIFHKKNRIIRNLYNKIRNRPHKMNSNRIGLDSKASALIVGMNYKNTPYELSGCINDAKQMAAFATSRGYKTVVTLTDDSKQRPTRNQILKYFKTLITHGNTNNKNTYLFFCSSHGMRVNDTNGDEPSGYDETIIPLDVYNSNPITDDELRQNILTKLKPQDTLIGIFDSCHSASIFDSMYTYLDSDNNNATTIHSNHYVRIGTCGQVITISGCTDAGTSADAYINGANCGAFTEAFLTTMKKYNNSCTWEELLVNMRSHLVSGGFTQIPQLSSYKPLDIQTKVCI
jgi:hypothetical protein